LFCSSTVGGSILLALAIADNYKDDCQKCSLLASGATCVADSDCEDVTNAGGVVVCACKD